MLQLTQEIIAAGEQDKREARVRFVELLAMPEPLEQDAKRDLHQLAGILCIDNASLDSTLCAVKEYRQLLAAQPFVAETRTQYPAAIQAARDAKREAIKAALPFFVDHMRKDLSVDLAKWRAEQSRDSELRRSYIESHFPELVTAIRQQPEPADKHAVPDWASQTGQHQIDQQKQQARAVEYACRQLSEIFNGQLTREVAEELYPTPRPKPESAEPAAADQAAPQVDEKPTTDQTAESPVIYGDDHQAEQNKSTPAPQRRRR